MHDTPTEIREGDFVNENALQCDRCTLPYSEFKGDLSIPDSLWMEIAPREGGGGVLCPNCIFTALSENAGSLSADATIHIVGGD